ncbi:alpha/beta-hydrolase [Dendrothele bispora CBS 962.96]|uniref:Alpha/beta-hydrolase n=1 Tax=Dendrothele bispora (strain CBS 962.96) TaxID=1314807 RepID=A0A4S8LPI0_DENBC|nr:alpha/beta-hydrolase [Dendrothele bispora CBS 962.96]
MALKYRHQPVKTLYMVGGVLWILARLPFWTVRNLVPAWRPHRTWSFGRSMIVGLMDAAIAIMLQTDVPFNEPLERLASDAKKNGFVWVDPLPDNLIVGDTKHAAEQNKVLPARVGGCWYEAKGSENQLGRKAAPGEKVFYFAHVLQQMGSAAPSYSGTALIAQGLLEHVKRVPRLFASEYRLARGPPLPVLNPYPTAMLDVLAGYYYLVHQLNFSPENIILVGDSAGGILAYQLVRYCIQYSASLPSGAFPVPGALLLLSPSADSALRPVPGSSMITNKRSDYLYSWYTSRYSVLSLLGNLPESELDRPWLSPGSTMFEDDDAGLKGIFESFPKTMIVAGEAEMARDCMRILRDRMRKEMGEEHVRYLEVEGAPHDFLGGTMWEPDRTVALKDIAVWANSL